MGEKDIYRRNAFEALYKVIEGRKISIGPLFDPYHKRMSEEEYITATKLYDDILLFLQNELNRLSE